MDEWFELWDALGGNIINEYDTLDDALSVVRLSSSKYGRESVDDLVLIRNTEDEDDDEDLGIIASGDALHDLAWAHAPSGSGFRVDSSIGVIVQHIVMQPTRVAPLNVLTSHVDLFDTVRDRRTTRQVNQAGRIEIGAV